MKSAKELSVKPDKSLGQNFLVDERVLETIASSALPEGERVLEIGPGTGNLTRYLSGRAKSVLSVEIDPRLVKVLDEQGLASNVTVIEKDFLKLTDEEARAHLGERFYAAGNLPYYVTTPICVKLMLSELDIVAFTVMMQKEVESHFTATEGSKLYAPQTVLTRLYYDVERITYVPRTAFYPEPEVDSVVLRFTARQGVDRSIKGRLYKFLRASFAQRRKTLVNCLSSAGFEKAEVLNVLNALDLPEDIRAERISPQGFVDLMTALEGEQPT